MTAALAAWLYIHMTTTHLNPTDSIGSALASQVRARLVDLINDAHLAGRQPEVAGRKVATKFSRDLVAQVWTNGSISVDVAGRKPGTFGVVWIKPGQSVSADRLI